MVSLVLRNNTQFLDPMMVNKIPPNGRPENPQILSTDRICSDTQLVPNQTEGSPAVTAIPGSTLALWYQENGHVTLFQSPANKPDNRGTVYIYGTTDSKPDDTLLGIHKRWNNAGNGGDGRGKLLAIHNFDDGSCYQINNSSISRTRQALYPHIPDQLMGADLWCHNRVTVPKEASNHEQYTLYWVWDWPTNAGSPDEKPEIYTTCIDVDVIE